MRKTRLLTLLVLLVAVVTGAWAQTETLLTTITATGTEQASYSTANVATVSFSYLPECSSHYSDTWGWWGYGFTATVTAAEGYTITKCVFYDNDGASATDSTDPFIVETEEQNKKPKVNGATFGGFTSAGIKKIEVYGYATYSVTLAEGTEDAANWTISPTEAAEGSPVTATYSGKKKKVKSVKAVKKAPANPYANAKLGDLFYSDGTFSTELEAGKTPIGVIAYLGTDAFSENGTTVGGSAFVGHGLVLSLKNAASDVEWGTEKVSKFSGQEVTSVEGLKRTTNVSGYTNTATLTVDAATAEKYPAAYQARNYTGLTAPTGTTGWFLPSAQQWLKMIEGLGGLTDGAPNFDNKFFDNYHTAADKWEAALSKAGSGNYDSMTSDYLWFWSSSECTENEAVSLGVEPTLTGYGCGFFWDNEDKGGAHVDSRVRPVLAF